MVVHHQDGGAITGGKKMRRAPMAISSYLPSCTSVLLLLLLHPSSNHNNHVLVSSQETGDGGNTNSNTVPITSTTNPVIGFEEERTIMTKLYSYTNGPYWSQSKNWLSDRVDVCDWYGITCTETGYIRSIHLAENKLSGRAPRELFQLSHLESLDLRANPIDVKFTYIAEASALTDLVLSDAAIFSLDNIGLAPSLEKLHLTNNDMTGTIPDELYDLTALKELYLNYNRFTGPLKSTKITQLSNLEMLYLYENHLSGELPAAAMSLSMTNLKELALSENRFTGTLPSDAFSTMTKLEILALQQDEPHKNVGLTGPLPDFANLRRLHQLYLGGNSFTGTIPPTLLANSIVKQEKVTIELINNRLVGTVPATLANFDMVTFYARGNELTGIDDAICTKTKWMGGDVGRYGCDAILCPPGRYSQLGRQSADFTKCLPCDGAPYRTTSHYGSTSCKLSQWQVLRHLYKDSGGSTTWVNRDGWDAYDKEDKTTAHLHDGDVCNFHGITCEYKTKTNAINDDDKVGIVTEIDLSGNNLVGYIPTSIYKLPRLQKVDLKDNRDVKVSFVGIGGPKRLSSLRLTNTTVDTTMEGIGDAQALTDLHLTYNNLEGELPDEFFRLRNLERLFLSYNKFNTGINPAFARLKNLKEFVAYESGFTGTIPWGLFGRTSNIEEIYLAKNQLTGKTPSDWFSGKPKLRVMNLRENPNLDIDFTTIGQATALQDLWLSKTGITSLKGISGAKKTLQTLHLTDNDIVGPIPEEIFQLTNLLNLFLNYNRFSGTLSSSIGQLQKLTELYLYGNTLEGDIPKELGMLTNLEVASMAENKFSGKLPTSMLRNLSNLNILALQNEDTVNPNGGIGGPLPDFANMTSLKEVYLGGNSFTGTIPETFMVRSKHKQDEVFVDLTSNKIIGEVPGTLASFEKMSLLLQNNQITSISPDLCDKGSWMDGEVELYGCDAILCPDHTTSIVGRQNKDNAPCTPCAEDQTASYYGSLSCHYDNGDEALSTKEILVKLYHTTGGPKWENNKGWLDNTIPLCNWTGVVCQAEGENEFVSAIKLPSNKLSGVVPREVLRIATLIEIDLSDNSIDMSFDNVGYARSLEFLKLSNTHVSDVTGISDVNETLTSLYLDSCALTGPFPDEITRLINLDHLQLSHNAMSGPLPDDIGRLTKLSIFHVYGNELTGQLPSSLGKLVELTEIDLAENRFGGTLPPEMNKWSKMTFLNLHQNTRREGVKGPMLDFADLKALRILVLDSNHLTGSVPSTLLQNTGGGQERILIDLKNNNLTGIVPSELADRFEDLILDLAGNQIGGIAPELCTKDGWMDGRVEEYGCDAILCPPKMYSTKGRQSNADTACLECDNPEAPPYYGMDECYDDGSTSDHDILKEFYFKTDGQNWANNDNWLSDTVDVCDWYGVNCTSEDRVMALNLESNGVSGSVAEDLFSLPALKHLNLKDNPIKFSFENIDKAKNLVHLKLSGTGLTSLDGIGNAKTLTELHLTDNELVGTIPDEVFGLVRMKKLFLDYNNFSGSLSPKIGQMMNLDELFLFANKLTGQIPEDIGKLTKLKTLALSDNEFSGTVPRQFDALTNLELLALQQTMEAGPGIGGPLPEFANFPKLNTLYLGPNNLSGTISPTFLGGLRDTKSKVDVNLSLNRIQGTVPASLQRFANLNLHLQGNKVSAIAPELCEMKAWQDGLVSEYGCDAILCPPKSFNQFGRHGKVTGCNACSGEDEAEYFGSIDCVSADARDERDILRKFYSDMNGPGWRFDTNWLEDKTSICDWYGISCPATGGNETVEVIYLAKNSLEGKLPEDLFRLPNLKEVHLGENAIDSSFEGIHKAKSLERLNLDRTGLKSLSGVGAAPSLKRLHVRSNDLYGNIPSDIYELKSLVELDLSDNKFSGELPADLRTLSNLKTFTAFKNLFSGYLPEWLGDLDQLEYLRLDQNDFSGVLPDSIGNLASMEHLDLSQQTYYGGMGLTGPLPDFSGANRMTELILKDNNLVGTIPGTLLQNADLNDVIHIDLRDNHLFGTLPKGLTRFGRLNIYLSNNEIDALPQTLCDEVPRWMAGNVEQFGCDAILCPPETYNEDGMQHSEVSVCQPCSEDTESTYFGSEKCAMSEKGILTKIYKETDGANWKNGNNWLTGDDICDWWGVTCESEEGGTESTVTKLSLGANSMSGVVPSEIFQLASLRELDLSSNDVDIKFQGVSRASSLAIVNVDSTNVQSLEGIGEARSLKELHAQKNNFNGDPIPEGVFSLFKLENLQLSASNFGGTLSDRVGGLANLQTLACSDNNIGSRIPATIGKLSKVESLILSENDWTGAIPEELGLLTSLKTLHINSFTRENSGLTGALPDFAKLTEMIDLELGSNQLRGTIPFDLLGGSTKTAEEVKIVLTSNQLNGTLPAELARFDQLIIDVTDNEISAIPPKLCEKADWMRGRVAEFGCDAILCAVGTSNTHGRQSNADSPCETCDPMKISDYFGAMQCAGDPQKELERDILTKFYDTCGGANWYKKKNWLDNTVDICLWEGISCHRGKYVDSILMGANNIVGTPPAELFDLPALEWLWLYSNPISFSFDYIGNAKNLRSLILDSTGLTSLEGIGEAKDLTELDVRFNRFSGPVPDELSLLTNIESISLSDNDFSGTLPSFLEDLTNLRKLRLGQNEFHGELPSFESLTELRALDLSGNYISGTIPPALMAGSADLSDIFIDLSGNVLRGTVPATLSRFGDLTIYLKDNLIEWIAPALCKKNDWNDGDVVDFGCDALMCPIATYNPLGRQSKQGKPCVPCDFAQYYGAVECRADMYVEKLQEEAASTRSAAVTTTGVWGAIFTTMLVVVGLICQ